MNEALYNLIVENAPPRESMYIIQAIENKYPQFNRRTSLRLLEDYRDIVLISELEPLRWNDPFKFPTYTPNRGLGAALNRKFAPIIKWFADNKVHEADRPKNWCPLDIKTIGYTVNYPIAVAPARQREIRLEWLGMQWNDTLRNITEEFTIKVGYDYVNDILYVSGIYSNRRNYFARSGA